MKLCTIQVQTVHIYEWKNIRPIIVHCLCSMSANTSVLSTAEQEQDRSRVRRHISWGIEAWDRRNIKTILQGQLTCRRHIMTTPK